MKSHLRGPANERRSIFPRLALRERAQNHPMIMFAIFVSAAFGGALISGEATTSLASAAGTPAKLIQPSPATKTSRLPIAKVGGACKGQSREGEAAWCLTMFAGESGKRDLPVRMTVDAAPTNPDTPDIFLTIQIA